MLNVNAVPREPVGDGLDQPWFGHEIVGVLNARFRTAEARYAYLPALIESTTIIIDM